LRGPIELAVRSPAALLVRGETLDVVLNDDGKPRALSFAAGALPAAAGTVDPEPSASGTAAGYLVGCALADDRVFCVDRTGAVRRAARDGSGDRVVASSRTGSRISAAPLAGSHAALAYLASRQTSEGWVSEAWLAVDDDVPVRLSEDGSGATSLLLVPRGGSLLAVSADARTALTTLHVRPVTFEGHARLGEDVVAFVGGPGDRRTAVGFAPAARGPSWALMPISKDIGSFGLAVVRVDDPPRVDEPVVWSMYPNGLDPAPVAAAVAGSTTWVARVRPRGPELGSARIVELGTIAGDGSFAARDELAMTGKPTDVALAADSHGAVWLAWVDGAGSWLERLACK
jgi:hypothetical protein